jgi:hypothetical protein
MAEPLADQMTRKIDQAAELYHRLLMMVAPAGMGKTSALHDVHERNGAPPSRRGEEYAGEEPYRS